MKAILHPGSINSKTSWEPVDAERVTQGKPQRAFDVHYASKDGCFSSGLYACTVGAWHIKYSEDEFCTLIEGHLRLIAKDGAVQEFKAPASFTIPSGYEGIWEAVTPVRKFFAIYEKQS
jgi:uncharacterized cupin superfamily protein